MTSASTWTHLDDDPCTTLHLPADVGSAAVARRAMVDDLRNVGMRESFIEDAQLVISELVANGVEHGKPRDDGMVEVSWCVHDDVVRISVRDGGTASTLRPLHFNDESLRGRGLAIVDALCDSWGVEADGGTRITAELRHTADVSQMA